MSSSTPEQSAMRKAAWRLVPFLGLAYFVNALDRSNVAVAALTQTKHEGKTYDITGPEALTHSQMAEQLSQALDHTVAFVDVPEGEFRNALRTMGMPDWQADGLIELLLLHQRLSLAHACRNACTTLLLG